jgi:putative transposase
MEQHKAVFNLERMAKVLNVSRSGYYHYLQTKGNRKIDKDVKILAEIRAIFSASKSTYGSPRIYAELRDKGLI